MNIQIKSKRTFINPWTKKSMIGEAPVSVPFDNLCRSLLRDGSVERCQAVGSEKGGTHTAKNGTKSVGNGTPGVEKKAVTPKKEAPAKVDAPVKNESK